MTAVSDDPLGDRFGLISRFGLDPAAGGGEKGGVCRFVTHPLSLRRYPSRAGAPRPATDNFRGVCQKPSWASLGGENRPAGPPAVLGGLADAVAAKGRRQTAARDELS